MLLLARFGLLNMLAKLLPALYLPADETNDGDDDDKAGDDKDGDDNKDEPTEAEKEAARLLAENRKLKDEARKAKADARKRDADKRTKKAIADDKLQDELSKREEELEATRERAEKLETLARERVGRQISKLPKDAQEEIALVKDDLSLEKLEALVEKRASSLKPTDEDKSKNGKPAPSLGMGGNDGKAPKGEHEIHAETKDVLKSLIAKPRQYDVAKKLGVGSDGKFGWGRGDDEHENTANFMHMLDRIKATPMGAPDDDAMAARVLGDKKK